MGHRDPAAAARRRSTRRPARPRTARRPRERERLFAAAAEHERIAALQPDDVEAALAGVDEQLG